MEARVTEAVAITRLRLERIRGFEELDLHFGESALVIGRNGTNKTTLLRAVALALADDSSASALLSQPIGEFVRRPYDEARIEITLSIGGEEHSWSRVISKSGIGESILPRSGEEWIAVPPVFAYGAGRGVVGGDSSRNLSADNFNLALSLFDYRRELDDPELTLRRMQDFFDLPVYDRLMTSLRRLLEIDDQDEIRLAKGGGIVLSGPTLGGDVPLAGWADGHRITLSWLLDLFGKAMQVGALDPMGHVTGILLLDELEQHLHPALQAGMFEHLQGLLPEMQIIATTHSPLVALGADPSQLVVLRRGPDSVTVDQSPRDYRGYTVEDMLADDRLFDAPVMAPAAQAQLDRYEELLAKGQPGRTPEEERELAALGEELVAEPIAPEVVKDLDATIAEIRQRLSS